MIEQAWNEYRGWAKRAQSLQGNTNRWNFWAMIALVACETRAFCFEETRIRRFAPPSPGGRREGRLDQSPIEL
jgi:hypothetical protein